MLKVEASRSKKRAGAVNPRTLLLLLLSAVVLGLLATSVLFLLNKNQKTNLSRKIEELDSEKQRNDSPATKESFPLAIARIKREETLAEARTTTNLLEKLQSNLTQVKRFASEFGTNSSGAKASDPALILRAQEYYDTQIKTIPTSMEIDTKVSDVHQVILQMESSAGTPLLPDLNIIGRLQDTSRWATNQTQRLTDLQGHLRKLLQGTEVGSSTTAVSNVVSNASTPSPSLPQGNTNAATAIAKGATIPSDQILAEFKAEGERILAETRIEVARILAETRRETEKMLAAAREEVLTRNGTDHRSENSGPRPSSAQESSKKTKAQDLALNPRMKAKLLPFTTPGNMRVPGKFRADAEPISLRQLQEYGALDPGMAGLQRLVEVATTPQDAIRPRWTFDSNKKNSWKRNTNEIEQVRAVQHLLIEHGPTLVEMGLLKE